MSNALYATLFGFLTLLSGVVMVCLAIFWEEKFPPRRGLLGIVRSMVVGLTVMPFFILAYVFFVSAGCYASGERIWHLALGMEKSPTQIAREEMGKEESEIRGQLALELQVLAGLQYDMDKAVYTPGNQIEATKATKRYLVQFEKVQKMVEKLKSLPPNYCPCSNKS